MAATLETEISAAMAYINGLVSGTIVRPSPKSAYIEHLNQKRLDLAELIAQNDAIIAANRDEELSAQEAEDAAYAELHKDDPTIDSRVQNLEDIVAELYGV